jgi:hypothetical protein
MHVIYTLKGVMKMLVCVLYIRYALSFIKDGNLIGFGDYGHTSCMVSCTTSVCTGDPKDVEHQEKKIYDIAAQYGGIPAGEKNGERGYMLTFVIAYIRVRVFLLNPQCYVVFSCLFLHSYTIYLIINFNYHHTETASVV